MRCVKNVKVNPTLGEIAKLTFFHMKTEFPENPEFLEALLDFQPTLMQVIIEHSDIEDLAFCVQNSSEHEKTFLYANLTKSELLEITWYIGRQREEPFDLTRVNLAHKRVSQKIKSAKKIVPDATLAEKPYESYSFPEKIEQLAADPESPEKIIDFFIAALVLTRQKGLLELEDYYDALRESGLNALQESIEIVVNGTDPAIRARAVRRVCKSHPLISRLLIAEGVDSLQMGHNPLMLHGRMCCLLREASIDEN